MKMNSILLLACLIAMVPFISQASGLCPAKELGARSESVKVSGVDFTVEEIRNTLQGLKLAFNSMPGGLLQLVQELRDGKTREALALARAIDRYMSKEANEQDFNARIETYENLNGHVQMVPRKALVLLVALVSKGSLDFKLAVFDLVQPSIETEVIEEFGIVDGPVQLEAAKKMAAEDHSFRAGGLAAEARQRQGRPSGQPSPNRSYNGPNTLGASIALDAARANASSNKNSTSSGIKSSVGQKGQLVPRHRGTGQGAETLGEDLALKAARSRGFGQPQPDEKPQN